MFPKEKFGKLLTFSRWSIVSTIVPGISAFIIDGHHYAHTGLNNNVITVG